MLSDRTRLHIALQKSGRLADSSRELLRDAGFRIQSGKNSLTARVENFPAELMFVRDDDIPTFVSDGVCEFGIVGQNVLEEFAADRSEPGYEVLAELGFGRCSLRIAAPESTPYAGPHSMAGQRIATSYPGLVGRFLKDKGIEATIVTMNGAVELAPRLQIANFICDLVSTGATLEANGLKAFDTVLDSQAVLVRTRKPMDAGRADIAAGLMSRIDGVLATKEFEVHHAQRDGRLARADQRHSAGSRSAHHRAAAWPPRAFRGSRSLSGIRVLGDAAEAQSGGRFGDPGRADRKDDDVKTLIWNDLDECARAAALGRPEQRADRTLRADVRAIIDDVRSRGWDGLCGIAQRLDGGQPKLVEVAPLAAEARRSLPAEAIEAIEAAARNIRTFHDASMPSDLSVETAPGAGGAESLASYRSGGHLCARGQDAPLLDAVDACDSGECRRRQRDRHRHTATAGRQPRSGYRVGCPNLRN